MSLKALFILLGFKVFIDETIAFIKFWAWLIVSHIVSPKIPVYMSMKT
jgi:hypothetical protein